MLFRAILALPMMMASVVPMVLVLGVRALRSALFTQYHVLLCVYAVSGLSTLKMSQSA